IRQVVGLLGGEATEEDRHRERRKLVVRHLLAGVAEHQLVPLLGRQLAAVALPLDHLRRPDHLGSNSSIGLPDGSRTTHQLPAGPSTRSPSRASPALAASSSGTSSTIRFQPPVAAPSWFRPELSGPLSQSSRPSRSRIVTGPNERSSRKPSRSA